VRTCLSRIRGATTLRRPPPIGVYGTMEMKIVHLRARTPFSLYYILPPALSDYLPASIVPGKGLVRLKGIFLPHSSRAVGQGSAPSFLSTSTNIDHFARIPTTAARRRITTAHQLSGRCLAISVTAGPSRRTSSPHPSSREGHHSTAGVKF
jgi:hypothetical protein